MYESYPGLPAERYPYRYGETSTPYGGGYYPYGAYGSGAAFPETAYSEPGLAQQERAKLKPGRKMPKEQALQLARRLKRWLVVTALVGFGTFSGLVAFQQAGQAAQNSSSTNTNSYYSQPSSSDSSSGQTEQHFFRQGGGDNYGSQPTSSNPFSSSGVS